MTLCSRREKGGKRSTLKHKEKVHTYFLTRKPCGVVFFSHRAPPLSVDVFISSDSMLVKQAEGRAELSALPSSRVHISVKRKKKAGAECSCPLFVLKYFSLNMWSTPSPCLIEILLHITAYQLGIIKFLRAALQAYPKPCGECESLNVPRFYLVVKSSGLTGEFLTGHLLCITARSLMMLMFFFLFFFSFLRAEKRERKRESPGCEGIFADTQSGASFSYV